MPSLFESRRGLDPSVTPVTAAGGAVLPRPEADQALSPSWLAARTCTTYAVSASRSSIVVDVSAPSWSWPPSWGSTQYDSMAGSALPMK